MKKFVECFLEESKDGNKIIRAKENDRSVYLGSKYNEKENINRFIKKLDIKDGESYIFIFGLGTGDYLKQLMKSIGYNNKILIFEPEESIYALALRDEYITSLLEKDERIHIFHFKDKMDILNILNRWIDKSYVNRYILGEYTNYDKIFIEELNVFRKTINEFWVELEALRVSNIMFSATVIDNYINNLSEVEKGINAGNLNNIFSGKTAVVVSSGPSLGKNVKLLQKYQDNCIIICAARSVQELIKNNIKPDFICAIDPGKIMEKLFKDSMALDIPLVITEQVNSNMVKDYAGKKIFVANSFKSIFEKVFKEEYVSIALGGSVAHLSTAFAVLLGVGNIIFIGQDLAFTDNKYHSSLSTNESLINQEAVFDSNDLFYVEGNVEEKVLINKSFLTFKNWFELFISENPQVNFVNSTEGGAKIEGTKILPLKNSLDIYCKEKIVKQVTLESQNREGILKKYFIEELSFMRDISLKGINYSEKMLSYYKGNNTININKILNTLDEIDFKFYKNNEIIYMLNLFSYEDMEQLNNKDEYREKIGENDREAGIRLAKRSLALYKIYNASITQIEKKIIKVQA